MAKSDKSIRNIIKFNLIEQDNLEWKDLYKSLGKDPDPETSSG